MVARPEPGSPESLTQPLQAWKNRAMNSDKELVLLEGVEGILAIGTREALDQWQDSAGTEVVTGEPRGLELSSLTAGMPDLLPVGEALLSRFLPAPAGASAPTTGGPSRRPPEVRCLVFGSDGKIQSSELINPTQLLRLDPRLMLVQAAVEVLAQSLAEIREELAEVGEGVQQLLLQSEAERLGDIYGRNKVLRRVTRGLNEGETLSTADWESLASLGPDLQIGTERLRSYLMASLRDLDYGASPAKRVRQLQKFMAAGRFVDHLKFLVVAEESLALYHRIRLERVMHTEPEAIEQTVRSVQRVLESNVADDMAVAGQLNRMLNEFALLRPAEGLDVLSRRRMDRLRAELHEVAREFVRHRAGQVSDWSLGESARVRDAFRHYREKVDEIQRRARQATADGLASAAEKAVQKIAPSPPPEEPN